MAYLNEYHITTFTSFSKIFLLVFMDYIIHRFTLPFTDYERLGEIPYLEIW